MRHLPRRVPSIAVAVPTLGRDRLLVQTIESVLAQDPRPDELLIVDQNEQLDPALARYLEHRSQIGELRWIRQQTPNLPRARNRALRVADTDLVLFLDDDVHLQPGLIRQHRRNYLDPTIWAVAGRTIDRGPTTDSSARSRWPRRLDYKYLCLDGGQRLFGVATMRGCNHSVRRRKMLEIGGYDENYVGWAYREDADAALRIVEKGGIITYDPEAVLIHFGGGPGGCTPPAMDGIEKMAELSFPPSYFAARHLYPQAEYWKEVFVTNVRRFVLRRSIAARPWILPSAVAGYVQAVLRSLRIARRGT